MGTMKRPAGEPDGASGVSTLDESKTAPERPPGYKVILVNDDFTPMEFVVAVLMRFFRKGEEEAVRLMLAVHREGFAVVGTYPYEIAEMKAAQVNLYSRQHEYPLLCRFEQE